MIKFFSTQRELKGLAAQAHSSRLNLSTYIPAGKALIEDKGYSRQLLLRCSNDSHPCEHLVKINNAAGKPFELELWELSLYPLTSLNLFDLEWLNRNKFALFLHIEKRSELGRNLIKLVLLQCNIKQVTQQAVRDLRASD